MKTAIKIWRESFSKLIKHPKLFIPFILAAGANLVTLYFLYLAPQRPVSLILAPPIRRIFGEKFLHYPSNLFILPKLYHYGQLVLSASLGVLMTGLAIAMLNQVYEGRRAKILNSSLDTLRRILSLVGIWLFMFLLSFSSQKLLFQFTSGEISSIGLSCASYFVILLVQLVFIYAMPMVMVEKRTIFGALVKGFVFFVKVWRPTIALVFIPALLYIPLIVLNSNAAGIVLKSSPEAIIPIILAGILVAFILDILFTIPTTLLFLKEKKGSVKK